MKRKGFIILAVVFCCVSFMSCSKSKDLRGKVYDYEKTSAENFKRISFDKDKGDRYIVIYDGLDKKEYEYEIDKKNRITIYLKDK